MNHRPALIFTCEHAVNHVPSEYHLLLSAKDRAALKSHKGYDAGALDIARPLARGLSAPLIEGKISRLLVDMNRSESNRRGIFGAIGRRLDAAGKRRLLDKWRRPFLQKTHEAIQGCLTERGRVILLSIHSFTPVLEGRVRNAEIGLLYDPSREQERLLAHHLREKLSRSLPGFRIRMNYPYRGVSDGTARAMRRVYPGLAALELEFNQEILKSASARRALVNQLVHIFTPTR